MPQDKGYNFKTRIKKIFLELLIAVIRGLIFLFLFLSKILLFVIGMPLYKIARFVFYKFVVKLYCYYLSFIRKLGWNRQKSGFLSFLFTEKTVHVAIMVITFVIVLTNLIPFTSADSKVRERRNAIIYNLVQSEFGEFDNKQELIKESLNKENLISRMNIQKKYQDQSLALKNTSFQTRGSIQTQATTSEQQEKADVQKREEQKLSQTQAAENSLKDREEIITYEVQSGDTVSTIADKFGVSVNTILWENDLSTHDLIRPGDKLDILPVTGVTHEVERGENLNYIANKYNVDKNKIVQFNDIENAGRLNIGEELIIPNGEKQEESSSDTSQNSSENKSSNYNALSAIKNIVKSKKTQSASNKMHWPTVGHTITQYYSWKHHAVDIANNLGTPLYAADSGVVEFAGWSRGYGNNIVINHGGGIKTRYAHMHKFYISRGERVSKGQTLGEMGSTGWSTGPHVHFEVIINGKKRNPLNYIK